MGQGENDMVVITGQEPRLLEGQPALGLEIGALGTRSMAAGVVPDARHMAVGARLHMTAQHSSPTLHDGARRSANVGREGMGVFIGGIGSTEDVLQGNESHSPPRIARNDAAGLP